MLVLEMAEKDMKRHVVGRDHSCVVSKRVAHSLRGLALEGKLTLLSLQHSRTWI